MFILQLEILFSSLVEENDSSLATCDLHSSDYRVIDQSTKNYIELLKKIILYLLIGSNKEQEHLNYEIVHV